MKKLHASALIAAALAVSSLPALSQAQEFDSFGGSSVIFRMGGTSAIYVDKKYDIDYVGTDTTNPGKTKSGKSDNTVSLESGSTDIYFSGSVMFTEMLGVEVSVGMPVEHSLISFNADNTFDQWIQNYNSLPLAVAFQWFPALDTPAKWHVGFGAAYDLIYDETRGYLRDFKYENPFNIFIQAGVHYRVSDTNALISADVSYHWAKVKITGKDPDENTAVFDSDPDSELNTYTISDVMPVPFRFSVAMGYQF